MKPTLLLLVCFALAGQHGQAPIKKRAELSDSYAKAAIFALKTIRADRASPTVEKNEILGSRHAIDAINTADAEAKNNTEKTVTSALERLYSVILLHNSKREFIETNYEIKLHDANELIQKINVDEAMSKDLTIADMKRKESACFDAFEDSLRARSSAVPTSCSDEALKIEEKAPSKVN